MEERRKKIADSKVQQMQVVMPEHINTLGSLFGGQLLNWIDVVAGLVAFRHVGEHCATASVEWANFYRPVRANEVLLFEGRMTYVGNASMEIRVDTFIEKKDRIYELVNSAYVTYVSIDENGMPKRAPQLEVGSPDEMEEWNDAHLRSEAGKERRRQAVAHVRKPSDFRGDGSTA